jgi:hypothetical protein
MPCRAFGLTSAELTYAIFAFLEQARFVVRPSLAANYKSLARRRPMCCVDRLKSQAGSSHSLKLADDVFFHEGDVGDLSFCN